MDQSLQEIYDAILVGDETLTKEKVKAALESGMDASQMMNLSMIPAMTEVGVRYEQGDYYIPEMLISAIAMQQGLEILGPHLTESEYSSMGTVVIGTAKGDLHDIGKNLVAMMMEGAGFTVLDLGTDVSAEKFIEAVRSSGAEVVAISALLTTTMEYMKVVIDKLVETGLRDQVKVIIGGAPITESYAQEIGADGYAADASRAPKLVNALLEA
jgi:5-methyltetrahydrofolate--homocysteine methyltransferase